MIPCMALPCYPLNRQVLAIFFSFATIPATPHYPEFTDKYSPQHGRLSLYCISWLTLFFDFHFPTSTSFLNRTAGAILFTLPSLTRPPPPWQSFSGPTPPSSSQSSDFSCVEAQKIMFLGRFLV